MFDTPSADTVTSFSARVGASTPKLTRADPLRGVLTPFPAAGSSTAMPRCRRAPRWKRLRTDRSRCGHGTSRPGSPSKPRAPGWSPSRRPYAEVLIRASRAIQAFPVACSQGTLADRPQRSPSREVQANSQEEVAQWSGKLRKPELPSNRPAATGPTAATAVVRKQLRTTAPGEPRPGLPPVSPLRATPATGGSQPQQVRLVIETRHRTSYLLEGPLCQQAAAVEVDDRVCAPDGSQPVRDRDCGHI